MGRMRLACGARRMLANHAGADGIAFSAHYRGLRARYGPFGDEIQRALASTCAALWIEHQRSTRDLDRARTVRDTGRGRRPNQAAIARLQKRQGLSLSDYLTTLRKLEELCAARPGSTLAERLSRRPAPPGEVR
jgi:hypothetical protein